PAAREFSESHTRERHDGARLGGQESLGGPRDHTERTGDAAAVHESESEIESALLARARRSSRGNVVRPRARSRPDARVAEATGLGAEDRRHLDAGGE